jgi:hypothetical protein
LGVDLGHNFIPPQEDNVTGFWEDAELNALNIDLLQTLNRDWHFLTPIETADVESLREKGYIQRAVSLIQTKLAGTTIFGVKDPRVAKLLPFWSEVFEVAQLNVDYVLVIRHPLSVCRSLERRHGFDFEKSSMLWLDHVLGSLAGTSDNRRILIDYDLFIQDPDRELARIANGLQLQINPDELEEFKAKFLDKGLRHTTYQIQDLMLEQTVLPLARDVYLTLYEVAASNIDLEDPNTLELLKQWETDFSRLKPVLTYIDKLYLSFTEQITKKDAQLQFLQMELSEIRKSKSWQVAVLISRIRTWLIPLGSRREKVLKYMRIL